MSDEILDRRRFLLRSLSAVGLVKLSQIETESGGDLDFSTNQSYSNLGRGLVRRNDFPYHMLDDVEYMEARMEEYPR